MPKINDNEIFNLYIFPFCFPHILEVGSIIKTVLPKYLKVALFLKRFFSSAKGGRPTVFKIRVK